MFSLLLLSSALAEDLVGEAECDIPAFIMGTKTSIKAEETISLDFAEHVALLPKFPHGGEGTSGSAAIASDGLGLTMSIGDKAIDIALSQIPEEGLPDMVDTVSFAVAVTSEEAGPSVSFAFDFKGVQDLKVCFFDTIANIAAFAQKLEGRRLQVAAEDLPPTTVEPEIDIHGQTEVISFEMPEDKMEYISDGDTMYAVNKMVIVLTAEGTDLVSINMTMTGPDPSFELATNSSFTNWLSPVPTLTFESPGYCMDGSVPALSVKDLDDEELEEEVTEEIGEMDLEDVGSGSGSGSAPMRRLTKGVDVDEASKNIAVQVLKKMHSTHEMYKAYKQKKQRLVRAAFIQYAVTAVLVFALLFSAGAVVRHSLHQQKFNAVAANDQEAHAVEGGAVVANIE